MSAKHPIIAVTGSSGAGTTSVTRTFNSIFRRERIKAVLIEGDSFHRYDRTDGSAVDRHRHSIRRRERPCALFLPVTQFGVTEKCPVTNLRSLL